MSEDRGEKLSENLFGMSVPELKSLRPLVILAGPTGVGKTAVSISLSQRIGGECISADSVQVYRGLDIGSAKASLKERENVPHHLIDVIDPETDYSVALFQKMASEAVNGVYDREHIPVLVGGTGFYIQALLYGIDFSEEDEEEKRRHSSRLKQELSGPDGENRLFQRLKMLDPAAAEKIHPHNHQRLVRALTYLEMHTGLFSEHNEEERKKKSIYSDAFFVLTDQREKLYERIDRRVTRMMEDGLLKEARWLKAQNLPETATALQGIGYREMLDYLDGKCTIDEAVSAIRKHSRNYAKRQLTWFRREPDASWINISDFNYEREKIAEWIIEKCIRKWE